MRELPGTTLRQLTDSFDSRMESFSVPSGGSIVVDPDLTAIAVGDHEVPYSPDGIAVLANWADFPASFFERLPTELKAPWLNELMRRNPNPAVVRVGEQSGILSVLAPNQVPVDPSMLVDVASSVLGEDASVVEAIQTPKQFDLDVVLPIEGRENLGDPQVGDIVKAGLRFGLNVGQNLAPTVQPYSYRLWCTNGCSSAHEGAKIDARGKTVDEVIAELEVKARLAFSMVEGEVEAMFALRNETVDNPERTINRMAREQGLSDRMRMRLIESIPSMVEDPNHVSMFDLTQAATNLANSPTVRSRGARLALEGFGANIIAQHVERCVACASKLN